MIIQYLLHNEAKQKLNTNKPAKEWTKHKRQARRNTFKTSGFLLGQKKKLKKHQHGKAKRKEKITSIKTSLENVSIMYTETNVLQRYTIIWWHSQQLQLHITNSEYERQSRETIVLNGCKSSSVRVYACV